MRAIAFSAPPAAEAASPLDAATTPCVEAARVALEAAGFEVTLFRATGSGGRALESAVAEGRFAGVLDITMTELADTLLFGAFSAGPDRLTAAALHGVPQVIVPGALDRVNFEAPEAVPKGFRGRRFCGAGAGTTLMRTTPEENDRLGREIALKASAARGPTALLLPLRGVSGLDREGEPFWWPEADLALFQSVRNWISPSVRLIELELHVNDQEFARLAVGALLEMFERSTNLP
jgi:uncharacterized protein (UPF0261 family)